VSSIAVSNLGVSSRCVDAISPVGDALFPAMAAMAAMAALALADETAGDAAERNALARVL